MPGVFLISPLIPASSHSQLSVMSNNSDQASTNPYTINMHTSFSDDGTFQIRLHFKTPESKELTMVKAWSICASITSCFPGSHAHLSPQASVSGISKVAEKSFGERLTQTLSKLQKPNSNKVCPSTAPTFSTLPSVPFLAVAPNVKVSALPSVPFGAEPRTQMTFGARYTTDLGPDHVLSQQEREEIEKRLNTLSDDRIKAISQLQWQPSQTDTTLPLIIRKHFEETIKELKAPIGEWTPSIHDDPQTIDNLSNFRAIADANRIRVYMS